MYKRQPLIEGGEAVFALADGLGALATFISGAGPTILSVVRTGKKSYRSSQKAVASSAARESLYTASAWDTILGSAARDFSVSSLKSGINAAKVIPGAMVFFSE